MTRLIISVIFLKRKKIGVIVSLMLLSALVFGGCGKISPELSGAPPNSESNEAEQLRERGSQIVAEYLKQDAAPFRKSRLRFTVTSENEPTTIYEIDVWRKQTENETLTLTHILKPAEDSKLSSLAVETKDKDTIITTYVASSDQFRETGAGKAFFGGVPAEELLGAWSKYAYRFVGEKDLGGAKVFEVEGKLNASKHSPVAQMTAYFRADNYLPAELHLFDSTGKELRTFRVKNYQTDAGGRAFVSGTEIENPVYKTRVAIDVIGMSFPNQMDDSLFTRGQLKQFAQK